MAAQAACLLMIVLIVATALVSLRFATHKGAEAKQAVDDLALAHQLTSITQRLGMTSRHYMLTRDPQDRQQRKGLDLELQRVGRELVAHASATHAGTEVARVAKALDAYVASLARAVERSERDSWTSQAVAELREQVGQIEAELAAKRGALDGAIDAFVIQRRAVFAASDDQSQRVARRAWWSLIFISALALALGAGLGVVVMRELARQAEQTRAAAGIAKQVADSRRELLASSHDLRAPLKEIVMMAASLEKTAPRDPGDRRALDKISTAAKQVDQLLEDLFDVSRIQLKAVALRCESGNADRLVELAISAHQSQAAERAIRLRSAAEVSTSIHADRERVCHVLTTLIGTAMKSARPGGEIVVNATPADNAVRFEVVDMRPRSLPEPLSRLVEQSSRSEPINGPNGLGLYICKRIVEAHGGHMGVDTGAGVSTYWFTIPTEPRHLR